MTCEPRAVVKQVYRCPCCHSVFPNAFGCIVEEGPE